MSVLTDLKSLTPSQRHVIAGSYLGWTLDAFDFFILVFVLKDIAAEFHTTIKLVTLAITLTLAMRPLGALFFGLAADRFGRKPVLMINILSYSVLEFASGFAPSLTVLIGLRALYGIAMGGEWGVGASLTMESLPPQLRGLVSGILQAGYPSGYLFASIVFDLLYPSIGWRGMFMVGLIPAALVFYIRSHIEESPTFAARTVQAPRTKLAPLLKANWRLFLAATLMMTCFNWFSHGTQDLYPTFLEQQRGLSSHMVGFIAIIYNIGAICGGITFGLLSNKLGRKRAIITASLLVLPILPIWLFSTSPFALAVGAFLIQFFVQGAWGVVPAHLNELSPDEVRGTLPGLVYQLGNLFASFNATLEAGIATAHGGDYAFAMGLVAGTVAVLLALVTFFGPEKQGRPFNVARSL